MAAIKASVNLFALLGGNDPGGKRLVDFDSQLKDQPKKKPAAAPGYKPPKKEKASGPAKKKPASAAAASTKKKPTSGAASGFKSNKNSTAPAAAYKSPGKNLTPAPVAATAVSMPRAMNKQTTPVPAAPASPARSTDLTRLLFAYTSARERIFKQRQEEFERRQAKAAENTAAAPPGSGDDGKNASAGAAPGDKRKDGKTHGVKVQRGGRGYYYNGVKEQPGVPVKEATSPPAPFTAPPAVEKPATAPVVKTTPLPPPPSIDDIDQFPSLK